MNRAEAFRLMLEGETKDSVYRKTGVTVALSDVSMNVKRGEIFVIIGLSGCGKSTVIRCMNMLHKPTAGKVYFNGEEIDNLSGNALLEFRRNKISMVFQSFGLMGHRDVLGNVAFGLEVKNVPKEEREKMCAEMKANSEAYNAQLQKIMTKDQYASYTKKQAEREQRMKDGRRQKK